MTNKFALQERLHTFDSATKSNSTVMPKDFEYFEPETLDYHGLEAIKSSTEGAEALT